MSGHEGIDVIIVKKELDEGISSHRCLVVIVHRNGALVLALVQAEVVGVLVSSCRSGRLPEAIAVHEVHLLGLVPVHRVILRAVGTLVDRGINGGSMDVYYVFIALSLLLLM